MLLAAPAFSDARIDTASGPAVLTESGIDTRLTLGGQEFLLEGVRFAGFDHQAGDWLLVLLPTGGTACPAMFAWVNTAPGHVALGPSFGTCSDLAEVTEAGGTLTVTMPSLDPTKGPAAFHWDGAAITEEQLAIPPSGLGPELGVAPWQGRYAHEFLTAPEWREPLLALMGDSDLTTAQTAAGMSDDFAPEDGWLVSKGCAPQQCDTLQTAVALRLSDNAVLVALWQAGQGGQVYGDLSKGVPRSISDLVPEN